MRRRRASRRRQAGLILIAGGAGYLLGGWHAAMLRSNDLSPAQTVALRFPDDVTVAAAAPAAVIAASATAAEATGANVVGDMQLALLSPEPMVPRALPAAETAPQTASQAAIPAAAPAPAERLPPDAIPPDPMPPAPMPPAGPKPAARAAAEAKLSAAPANRRAERTGFVLNDAQIASIKRRLHLTPDQERMWPAVEAALRNIAYARARDPYRRGGPAGATDLAALDPSGAEVQDLKSAAIPLIMSFSDDQRNEVRSLAHVMGLDNLASEL